MLWSAMSSESKHPTPRPFQPHAHGCSPPDRLVRLLATIRALNFLKTKMSLSQLFLFVRDCYLSTKSWLNGHLLHRHVGIDVSIHAVAHKRTLMAMRCSARISASRMAVPPSLFGIGTTISTCIWHSLSGCCWRPWLPPFLSTQ